MFVLDTDSITHDQNAHPILIERVKNTLPKQLFTTSVTVEEQLKGRLAYLNRHRNSPRQSAQGHAALVQTLFYFSTWNILVYHENADALVRQLLRHRLRIGSQVLRIAAIALAHGFTVVMTCSPFCGPPEMGVVYPTDRKSPRCSGALPCKPRSHSLLNS